MDVYVTALMGLAFASIDVYWCPSWPVPSADLLLRGNGSVRLVVGGWSSRAVQTDVFIVIDGGGGGGGWLASTAVAAKFSVYHGVAIHVAPVKKVFRRATVPTNGFLHPALRFDAVIFPSRNGTAAFTTAWARFYHESDRRLALMLRPPQILAWPPLSLSLSLSLSLPLPLSSRAASAMEPAVRQTERVVIDGVIASVFREFIGRPIVTQATRRLPVYGVSVETLLKGGAHAQRGGAAPQYAAVIVEPRLEGALEFCVRNVLAHLPPGPSWMMQIHHSTGPLGNERYIKRALSLSLTHQHHGEHAPLHPQQLLQAARIEFVSIAAAVSDGDSYNNLVRSAAFWQQLSKRKIEKVLFFQTDSVMLRGGRADDWPGFMPFDYVGAPWHLVPGADSAAWLRDKQRGGVLRNGVGNGGFSLRSVDAMLYIATEYGNSNFARRNNEDAFFAHHCEKMHAGLLRMRRACTLPDRALASVFAVEVPCPDVNYTLGTGPGGFIPIGLHNTWAYVDPVLGRQLLQLSIQ